MKEIHKWIEVVKNEQSDIQRVIKEEEAEIKKMVWVLMAQRMKDSKAIVDEKNGEVRIGFNILTKNEYELMKNLLNVL